jgi:Mrp family chromosome partitioning ATPase
MQSVASGNRDPVPSMAADRARAEGDVARMRSRAQADIEYLRRRRIYVSPDDEEAKIAISAFKSLRTHMLKAMQAKGVSSLAITGTTKLVGKSTVAANLAVNFARHQRKHVLLVDLDLRVPSVASMFGLSPRIGIDSVMDEQFRLEDALVHTDIPGLSILPCVRGHENSTEILLSEEMRRLFAVLCKPRPDHVVIFDGPPVLGCDDIPALAAVLDLFLVVVAEGRTTRREIKDVMRLIGDANVAAVVLNGSRQKRFRRYYY